MFFKKTETIRYTINVQKENGSTNITCHCKNDFGGGMFYTRVNANSGQIRYFSYLLLMFNTTDYLSIPQFVIKASEQYYVSMTCDGYGLCGYPETRIAISTAFLLGLVYAVTGIFGEVFSHGICRIKSDCSSSIGQPLFLMLQPVGVVFSLLSIPPLVALVKKEGTAFTLQLFQSFSCCLQTFFYSDWVRMFIIYIYLVCFEKYPPSDPSFNNLFYGMSFVAQSLYNFTFFMSFCLLIDRFISVRKPLKYKRKASKKKAIFISIILLILSLLLNIDYYLRCNKNDCTAHYIMMTFRGMLVFCMIIMEVILCVFFVKLFVKQSNIVTDSELISHQKNVSFILIGSVVIDSVAMCVYSVVEFGYGSSNLFHYTFSSNLNEFLYLCLKIINAIAPTVSVIICISFSIMYRTAFLHTYCFIYYKKTRIVNFVSKHFKKKANQVNVINLASQLKQRTTRTNADKRGSS